MLFYAISGRIPGDDEDTTMCVGQFPDKDRATEEFESLLCADLSDLEVQAIIDEYGQRAFINAVITSTAEMDCE